MKKKRLFKILIIISILLSIPSCMLFIHNEPYETIPIEGLDFCAFRHDSEYYKLHLYNKENGAGQLVLFDHLQSIMYEDDVIVARCAINSDFFVRYYFITFAISNSENYFISGPISEQVCLDSLSARKLDPLKMRIINFNHSCFP